MLCCITHFTAQFNPADGTTYYCGNSGFQSGTIGNYSVKFPCSGYIKYFAWNIFVLGTLGSNENVSLYLNEAGAETLITSTEQLTAVKNEGLVDLTASPIAVTSLQYSALKMVCPTWATNPTAVVMRCDIYWTPGN